MPCLSCKSKTLCKSREIRIKESKTKLNTLITVVTDNQDYKRLLKEINTLIEEFGYCIDYNTIKEITNYVESEYNKHS